MRPPPGRPVAALDAAGADAGGIALALGADLPVCLADGPRFVGGIGEELEPAPALPRAYLLLVNPRRPLPTIDVFAAIAGGLLRPRPLRRTRRPMRARSRRCWPSAATI